MQAAHDQTLVVDAVLIVIILAFFGIAYQFWTRRRYTSARPAAALTQLVVIFIVGALCGFLPRLVPTDPGLLLIAHIVLAAAAWAYMLAGQVDRLTMALDIAETDAARDAENRACAWIAEQMGALAVAEAIKARIASAPLRGASS